MINVSTGKTRRCRLIACLLCVALSLFAASSLTMAYENGAEESGNTVFQVGDTLFFGSYIQENGFEPIEWIVLDRQGTELLLISRFGLDCQPFNEIGNDVIWENCSLRTWLNDAFLNEAFSPEEQQKIVSARVQNPANPMFGTDGGDATEDRVFLLSVEEEEQFFAAGACKATGFASISGADRWRGCWWLRTSGKNRTGAAFVDEDGFISYSGIGVETRMAVRPALWVDFASDSFSNPRPHTYRFTDDLRDIQYGDVLSMGRYEQDGNESNGREEIEWIVLDRQNDSLLLVSRYALDCVPYHREDADVTWETCSLRTWLNGNFLNEAFSMTEQDRIVSARLQNPANPIFGTDGGSTTTDKVFLLSWEEAQNHFASCAKLAAMPTWNAVLKGWHNLFSISRAEQVGENVFRFFIDDVDIEADLSVTGTINCTFIDQQADIKVIMKQENHKILMQVTENGQLSDSEETTGCWWWLRSPGSKQNEAMCLPPTGKLFGYANTLPVTVGAVYLDEIEGMVRPATWISIS